MEKAAAESETHDFMNVESFSQLPFIRPPPPVKEKGIRLFGKEFGGPPDSTTNTTDQESSDQSAQMISSKEDQNNNHHQENGSESSRKFECHYCCRNFPTSQALGGHQNAHKRERQNAKRAHLQSAMVHGAAAHEAHVYGLMNYHHHHRLSSLPTTPYHSSWGIKSTNSYMTNNNSRLFHASFSDHHQTPINGSPLGLWRINQSAATALPSSVHHPAVLPLFSNDDLKPSANPQVMMMRSNSQTRIGFESSSKPKIQDHVSLDLHL